MVPRSSEDGFGLVELVVAMIVLQVALLAFVGVFVSGGAALNRVAKVNTASVLADQQLELYRTMPYQAIGLDLDPASPTHPPTTGNYVVDMPVYCVTGATCVNTIPKNPSDSSVNSWTCAVPAPSGLTSVPAFFTANGINPCIARRQVASSTTPPSPDGRSYWVDTYVQWIPPAADGSMRALKQVSVVVRYGTSAPTALPLAKVVGTFDCSTGSSPDTPC